MESRRAATFLWLLAVWILQVDHRHSRCEESDELRSEESDSGKVDEIIQELFLGEVVYPQERHAVQLTTGLLWSRDGAHDAFSIPLVSEFGLTDRWEIEVEVPVSFVEDDGSYDDGIGNIKLGTLYNFLSDPRLGLASSVGFEIAFPEVSSGTGEEAYSYEPFLVLYKSLDPLYLNVSGSLEIEAPEGGGEDTEVAGDIVAAAIMALGPLVPTMELQTEIEEGETAVTLAPGMIWRPHPDWELGLSVPVGLNEEAEDFGVFFMLSWEWQPAAMADGLEKNDQPADPRKRYFPRR